jgi:hypothetical protein
MNQPTSAEIRGFAPPLFVWADFGFPAPSGSDPDPLDARVGWAVGTLFAVTGRTLASITTVEHVAIAQRVLTAFVLLEALGGGEAALSVMESPWLKSFTAGSYSETRFSPSELGLGKAPPFPPALWTLLWALMTDDMKDEWIFRLGGPRRPAGTFVEPDWGFGAPSSPAGPMVWGSGIETWWP